MLFKQFPKITQLPDRVQVQCFYCSFYVMKWTNHRPTGGDRWRRNSPGCSFVRPANSILRRSHKNTGVTHNATRWNKRQNSISTDWVERFFFFFIASVLVVTFPSMQTHWPGQLWQYVHKHNSSLIKCRIVLCKHWYVGREATRKRWRTQMSEKLCVKTNCRRRTKKLCCSVKFTVPTLVLLLFMLGVIFNIFQILID